MANPLPNIRLEIRDPLGATVKAVCDNLTDTGGIVGGFAFTLSPGGDCLSLEFNAVMRLPDGSRDFQGDGGDLVTLEFDGVPAFAGVIDERPDLLNPNAALVQCGSRMALLDDRIPAPRRWLDIADLSVVVTDTAHGLRNSLPPGVTFNENLIQTGLGSLEKFYLPWISVGEQVRKLAEVSALGGVAAGVNARGELFLRQPTGVLELDWSEVADDLQYGQVQAEEICTGVNLILEENNPTLRSSSGLVRTALRYDAAQLGITLEQAHQGHPVCVTYSGAGDPQFNRRRTVIPTVTDKYAPQPDSLVSTPQLLPIGEWGLSSSISNEGQTERVYTNLNTISSAGTHTIRWENLIGCVGFRLRYAMQNPTAGGLTVWFRCFGSIIGLDEVDWRFISLPPTGDMDKIESVEFILAFDGAVPNSVQDIRLIAPSVFAGGLEVYEFVPLEFNPQLERIAKSLYRLPSSIVTAIPLRGYHPPAGTVRILNHPTLGTLEADAAEFRYTYTENEGFTTLAQLGDRARDDTVRQMLVLDRKFDQRNVDLTRALVRG